VFSWKSYKGDRIMAGTVIINDETLEYEPGERLLPVARRNAAHIGFVCNGQAICQTCRARVLEGSEHVSAPNQAERSLLSEARLALGYRLACQTTLTGPGPVRVLTRAEELRRQAVAVTTPPPGTTTGRNLGRLINNVAGNLRDSATLFPSNLQAIASRALRLRITREGVQQSVNDLGRIANRMISGKPPQTATQVPIYPDDHTSSE
jgi:ferredoxin